MVAISFYNNIIIISCNNKVVNVSTHKSGCYTKYQLYKKPRDGTLLYLIHRKLKQVKKKYWYNFET